ncbi:MLX-interacting protein-like isoform X1 [Anolis sagrei]|uniref:MLX-interacting protein-like isoform X1 n=1 Tax=Anolis sagrei TaxID=38937 RepID=UPI0035207905
MARPQIIHSGHFMVSEPHAEPEPDPEAELSPARREGPGPCAADQASASGQGLGAGGQGTCLVYRYGPRSSGALNIDASLSKLFECMTLAYSGKIVSPKWKTFKGLNLLQRDKIRLNNAIWRAWYLQYVEKRQNPVCGFVTPLECSDVDEHRKPEAVIMEGKYWKRQIGVVIREYHKWRTFFHTQVQKKLDKPICGPIQEVESVFPGIEMNSEMASGSPMDLDPLHDLEAFLDTIYSSRNPYGGPNLRGLGKAHQGNADMIQPTLTQLHPIFGEEFMDTLDPIHEFINSCHSQPAVQAPALVTDTTALGHSDPDLPTIVSGASKLPSPGYSLMPLSLSPDVKPPAPHNGQRTFLPSFHPSPQRTSPPPAPSVLHVQPQIALVFSVITQTGSENNSLPTSGPSESTFAVPTSSPTAMGGRCRQLQRIAPAPSSSQQPSPPCTTFTRLLTTGPAPLPLTSVTNSSQDGDTQKLSTNVSLSAVSATEKYPLPPPAFPDTGAKTRERCEEKILCGPQEMYKRQSAKGSCRSSFASSDCARRMIISSGFNTLASLVLPGSDQNNAKLSKALLLQKSVAYVRRLQQERQQAQETVESLRSEIEELSTAIDEYQRQLPPNGAPVLPPQSDRASQLYEDYVHQRTLQDWRFWLFSVVIKPLFESYTRTVNTTSIKEFRQSVLSWLEQHCTLPILRPAISGSLLNLSKITSILTQPAQLPEQALQAVSCPPHRKGNS